MNEEPPFSHPSGASEFEKILSFLSQTATGLTAGTTLPQEQTPLQQSQYRVVTPFPLWALARRAEPAAKRRANVLILCAIAQMCSK